jgi:hypothetical protein
LVRWLLAEAAEIDTMNVGVLSSGVWHMAYARLDIYWPDGRIESYLLEAPVVTVGRASDNTIVLDTETVSRHHFSITHTNSSTYLNDLESENGVIIDGKPLKSYEAHILEGVEELQVGFLRLIYHPLDESVTVPMKAADFDTQRSSANAELALRLDVNQVDVWPASSASAELAITNHLNQPQRLSIKISGMPSEWIRVNRPELEVAAKDTTYVLINIKPPRRPDVRPQDYVITVEVTPKDRPESALRTTLPVRLHGFGGFGMQLSSTAVQPEAPLLLTMQNYGSEELTVALSGRAENGTVQVRFSMPRVTLGAGARAQVRVEALPTKRPWIGQPQTSKFTVMAQAQNASRFLAAQEVQITVAPRLSRAAVGGLLMGLALMAAVLTAALGALRGTPTPTLENLRVNRTELAPGEDLILSWDAENAELYRISINQILVTEVPGDQRSVTLSTSGYTDDIAVAVVALNGERSVIRQLVVDITVPLRILSFTSEPAQLVRYVVSGLQLTWNAQGATSVSITGLDSFTNAPVPSELAAQGRLDGLTGYAVEPLNLVLTARDERGNVVSQTIRVDVVDAVCTTTTAAALYDGPSADHQQVSTVNENTPLLVVARDQSASWLRIGLPGNPPAWARAADVRCADNFRVNDLRVELAAAAPAPPAVVPTAILTPTPTTAAVTSPPPTVTPLPTPSG